jgi:hypothetical protein
MDYYWFLGGGVISFRWDVRWLLPLRVASFSMPSSEESYAAAEIFKKVSFTASL